MPTIAQRAVTREDKGLVTSCQAGALTALREEVDRSGVARKALATDVCDGDEALLSKRLAGVPGRPFALADLDKMPRPIVVRFLKRYGALIGVKVVDLEPGEVSERLLTLVDELASVAKLARIVMRPIKVKLPADAEE